MSTNERIRIMQAYRMARLVQESLEDRKSNPCRGGWTKDDETLWTEATAQEQALYSDAKAIANRIVGKWGSYTLQELVEWWFLRDCPWDYVIPADEWGDLEQAMLAAIASADC